MDGWLHFPNPVNEKAARTVAAGVAITCLVVLASGWLWLTAPLAIGFVARVLTGPRLSPLGLIATRLVAPRLGEPKLVPGPPKRFAQGIGATLSLLALVAHFALGATALATALVAMIAVAATLESVFALCLGCTIFSALMRAGVIPAEVCEACNDLGRGRSAPVGAGR